MISYAAFWNTLRQSNESTYTLIKNHHISSSTIDKLRKNKPLNTTTINDLCRILHCHVADVMEYVPSDDDQVLYSSLRKRKTGGIDNGRLHAAANRSC